MEDCTKGADRAKCRDTKQNIYLVTNFQQPLHSYPPIFKYFWNWHAFATLLAPLLASLCRYMLKINLSKKCYFSMFSMKRWVHMSEKQMWPRMQCIAWLTEKKQKSLLTSLSCQWGRWIQVLRLRFIAAWLLIIPLFSQGPHVRNLHNYSPCIIISFNPHNKPERQVLYDFYLQMEKAKLRG